MSDYAESRFADRHIGPDRQAIATMLDLIGVRSLDDLARRAVPADILDELTADGTAPGLDRLPPAASDAEALADVAHNVRDIGASIASGSFQSDGMIIAPCSITVPAPTKTALLTNGLPMSFARICGFRRNCR